MTNYNDGKWHGHNGGECPVHPETVVEWVTKGTSGSGKAGVYFWGVEDHENCLIRAFRVINEHKEPREFWLCGWTICTKREAAERVRDDKHDGLMEIIHVREVIE